MKQQRAATKEGQHLMLNQTDQPEPEWKETMATSKNAFTLSLGAAFAVAALHATAATDSGIKSQTLSQGYQLAANDAKMPEGKCGEGKCGANKKKAAPKAAQPAEGKCGEGKCGAGMKKQHEGKCGGDAKKPHDGSCGAQKKPS